jgi:hypothetical protein
LNCEPGPFEPTSQPARVQTTRYPLVRQRHSERHASGSGLAPDDAPVPPSGFHGPSAPSSNNHVPTASWQEQYNSEQTTAQYSAQDAPWSQAVSSEGQIDSRSLTDIFSSMSAYQTQPSHFPHYNPFLTVADTYRSSSQWQDSDTNNQTLEMEQGGHRHTSNRPMGDDSEWLLQSPNSGALDPSRLPLTQFDNPWSSNETTSSQPRHPQFHSLNQSTAQAFIPKFQLSREQYGEEYEDDQ